MAGCLDNMQLPNLESLNVGERRNKIASVSAGVLFFVGWWIALDAAAVYTGRDAEGSKDSIRDVFHICGVFGTISMFM